MGPLQEWSPRTPIRNPPIGFIATVGDVVNPATLAPCPGLGTDDIPSFLLIDAWLGCRPHDPLDWTRSGPRQ